MGCFGKRAKCLGEEKKAFQRLVRSVWGSYTDKESSGKEGRSSCATVTRSREMGERALQGPIFPKSGPKWVRG